MGFSCVKTRHLRTNQAVERDVSVSDHDVARVVMRHHGLFSTSREPLGLDRFFGKGVFIESIVTGLGIREGHLAHVLDVFAVEPDVVVVGAREDISKVVDSTVRTRSIAARGEFGALLLIDHGGLRA